MVLSNSTFTFYSVTLFFCSETLPPSASSSLISFFHLDDWFIPLYLAFSEPPLPSLLLFNSRSVIFFGTENVNYSFLVKVKAKSEEDQLKRINRDFSIRLAFVLFLHFQRKNIRLYLKEAPLVTHIIDEGGHSCQYYVQKQRINFKHLNFIICILFFLGNCNLVLQE